MHVVVGLLFADCGIMDTSDDPITLDPDPPSLVDEGLRIARQYGLGADFESELEGLKKATNADAVAHEGEGDRMEGSAAWNNGPGMADLGSGMADLGAMMADRSLTGMVEVDQAPMTT